MSNFLTVAGIALDVLEETAYEEPPDFKGNAVAVDDNTLQNSERDPKRKFACVVRFFPTSGLDTFLAAISVSGQLGVPTPVPVTSDADGLSRGASLTMWVRVGRVQYRTRGAGIFKTTKCTVPLAFREA